jgi:hypothetical protein
MFRSKMGMVKEMLMKKHVSGVLKADVYICGRDPGEGPPPCSFHIDVAGPHLSNVLDDHWSLKM